MSFVYGLVELFSWSQHEGIVKKADFAFKKITPKTLLNVKYNCPKVSYL